MSWPDWIQVASNAATVLALIGIWLAWRQFRATVVAEKQSSAIAAWSEYLRLALAHPKHARPSPWVTGQGAGTTQHDEYRWFVAAALFACEQVLEAHPDDRSWEEIVAAQLRYHRGFLMSPHFDASVYSKTLARLSQAVVNGPALPPPAGE